MYVIAGHKTGGKISGQILLNGHEAIQRSTGYCEQMDIHSEASTFREALAFSVFLRQDDDVPDAVKHDWVKECLDLLDLGPIAIVSSAAARSSNEASDDWCGAGCEAELFLDEPTSGLDARSAKIIMGSVRRVANTGRTVVCTIHQPSAEVFEVFDSLLLMKRGGYTVYFGELGEDASALVNYLQSIEGIAPLGEGYNPATWMLESIGAGVDNLAAQHTDFAEVFNRSAEKAQLLAHLEREGVARPARDGPALEFKSKRVASNMTQFRLVTKRFIDLSWRSPSYNLTRVAVNVCLGLAFATQQG